MNAQHVCLIAGCCVCPYIQALEKPMGNFATEGLSYILSLRTGKFSPQLAMSCGTHSQTPKSRRLRKIPKNQIALFLLLINTWSRCVCVFLSNSTFFPSSVYFYLCIGKRTRPGQQLKRGISHVLSFLFLRGERGRGRLLYKAAIIL